MITEQTAKLTTFVFDGKPYQTQMKVGRLFNRTYECEIIYNNHHYFGYSSEETQARQTAIGRLECGVKAEKERQKIMSRDMEEQLLEIWKNVQWEMVR
jgi:hypothetical protein